MKVQSLSDTNRGLLGLSPFHFSNQGGFSFPLLSEIGLFNLARGYGERCKLLSGVWGGAPAEIDFGAF